jgi:GAF domain-containing protein
LRDRVEPFTDNEIELLKDFAAEAAIALEITHRERPCSAVRQTL